MSKDQLKEGVKILLTLENEVRVKANIQFVLGATETIIVTYKDAQRRLVYKPFPEAYIQENAELFNSPVR